MSELHATTDRTYDHRSSLWCTISDSSWYGVLIVIGALLAARRASARGYDPEHVWNLLLAGMTLGIIAARLYYIVFEWGRYAGKPLLEVLNPQGGGLAIHGAMLATVLYARRYQLPLIRWLDPCLPTMLLGQAIGRWGNFFNQEAYGRPTTLPWGLDIAPEQRLPPYDNLAQYPLSTRFHPTFLYESLWDGSALLGIVWIERRFRARLKPGDSSLFYGILYSAGRFVTEGLRIDSLCIGPYSLDGACTGGFRIAQIVSLSACLICSLVLVMRHRHGPGQDDPASPQRERLVDDTMTRST